MKTQRYSLHTLCLPVVPQREILVCTGLFQSPLHAETLIVCFLFYTILPYLHNFLPVLQSFVVYLRFCMSCLRL